MLKKLLFEKVSLIYSQGFSGQHSQPKATVIMEYMRFSDTHSHENSVS